MLFDVTRLIWRAWRGFKPTGIDRVCLAYLDHYAHRSLAVIQYPGIRRILTARVSQKLFQLLLEQDSKFRKKLIVMALANIPSLIFSAAGRNRIYLNVGHTGLDKTGHLKWVQKRNVRAVYFLHDLIPITHPQFCRPGEKEKHERRIRNMLAAADGIIGNSAYTLHSLEEFSAQTGMKMPLAIPAWLGTTKLKEPADHSPPIQTPYFLMIGTIEGRKNHIILLKLWQELSREHQENSKTLIPKLVIIGQRGWECDDVVHILDHDPFISQSIIELSHCSDQDLSRYIRHARALLFPSFAEGYGMPLMEAFDQSTPVIASDLETFRETAGDVPDYLAPHDLQAWKKLILEYAENKPDGARAKQLERMTGFHTPTWPDHFREVDHFLDSYADC